MKQGHSQDRSIGEQLQGVDALVERVSTLDADEGRVVAGGSRSAELRGGANVSDPGRLLKKASKGAEVLLECTSAAARRPGRIGRDHPGRAAETDLPRRREVGMPEKASPEQSASMSSVEVVAEDPAPDEGLDVQVDRVRAAKELDGFLGDPELLSDATCFHATASLTRPRAERFNPGELAEKRSNSVL
jgi:hypothetical protein